MYQRLEDLWKQQDRYHLDRGWYEKTEILVPHKEKNKCMLNRLTTKQWLIGATEKENSEEW